MADTEQIEFAVLVDGDPVEWFTVSYSDTFNTTAINEQRDLAIACARKNKGEVEQRTTYAQDREIVWPSDFEDD